MKRVALVTAILAVTSSGAFAQQAPVQLSSAITSEIMTLVPNADLSNLTNVQYAQLVTLFSNSDYTGAGDNAAGQVKAILNAQ